MPTLHIALDESGDLNFAPAGTRFYTFSVVWTYEPATLATALRDYRFALLKAGYDIPAFHATYDKQEHRDQVVKILTGHQNWSFAAIVIEKNRVNPAVRDPHVFYPKFAGMLLNFIFRGSSLKSDTTQVIACTDTLPVKKQQEAITKTFKQAAKANLPKGCRFDIYHHRCESNKWIQIADYCCWSVHRKWERGDPRTYDQLQSRLKAPELEVFRRGDGTKYY